MKAKIVNGMLFIQPETEDERKDLTKWQENVLENYDPLMDWMFWFSTKGEEDDVFETES